MRRDLRSLAKVRAINTACQQVGIRTVATFVEDQCTLAALRGMGVDYAQGFGIGRPEPFPHRAVA